MWILHPPGKARAVVMRSRVLICWKAERRMSAIRTLLLIGGSTAMLLMLRNYGDAKEER